MKKFLIIGFFLFFSINVFADEIENGNKKETSKGVELPMIIITPTKYETPLYSIPSSFTVI